MLVGLHLPSLACACRATLASSAPLRPLDSTSTTATATATPQREALSLSPSLRTRLAESDRRTARSPRRPSPCHLSSHDERDNTAGSGGLLLLDLEYRDCEHPWCKWERGVRSTGRDDDDACTTTVSQEGEEVSACVLRVRVSVQRLHHSRNTPLSVSTDPHSTSLAPITTQGSRRSTKEQSLREPDSEQGRYVGGCRLVCRGNDCGRCVRSPPPPSSSTEAWHPLPLHAQQTKSSTGQSTSSSRERSRRSRRWGRVSDERVWQGKVVNGGC